MIRITDALLLRSHPYSETSLILRFLTPDLGVMGVMARGVRRGGSKGRSGPGTFDRGRLEVQYRPNRDLQTLRDFHVTEPGRPLGRDVLRFTGASLLAELVLAQPSHDASPELFRAVADALERLRVAEDQAVGGEVLAAGWRIVRLLGYAPRIGTCVRCGRSVPAQGVGRFDHGAGGVRCPACVSEGGGIRIGPRARRDLEALLRDSPPVPLRGPRGHLGILAAFATHHLDLRRPLRTTGVLRDLLGRRGSEGAAGEGANFQS